MKAPSAKTKQRIRITLAVACFLCAGMIIAGYPTFFAARNSIGVGAGGFTFLSSINGLQLIAFVLAGIGLLRKARWCSALLVGIAAFYAAFGLLYAAGFRYYSS